ncbi:MAG TPA: N-acetylmuramoyl-L-alanine amidase [Vicinamibacterales bacterium]|nr:N-acetylmuramoyl-L-alanine amidase [Vicinamibacterales bacterium]
MLRAAVQDNADTIADRVPTALRPSRRFLALWLSRARVLLLPVGVAASMFVAHWSLAAEPVVLPFPVNAPASERAESTPPSPPDMSLLARPLPPSALALGVRRVVLDAGHGGAHQGTASTSGLLEKHVTLDLAERARKLLIARGFEVVLTRTADDTLSLKERATTANQQRGDIFVSIHLNSFARTTARGVETFYLGPGEHPDHDAMAAAENQHSGYSLADMRTLLDGIYVDARRDESKRLAQSVQRAMMQRLGKSDPELEDRGVKTAPFVVLVATEMPAILAEVSCLSNPDEAERLGTTAHRQAIAEALVSGIRSFTDHKTQLAGQRKDSNER